MVAAKLGPQRLPRSRVFAARSSAEGGGPVLKGCWSRPVSNTQAYDKALSVEVYDGEVVLRTNDGPMAVSLTPRAAAETAEQLAKAASLAETYHRSQGSIARE